MNTGAQELYELTPQGSTMVGRDLKSGMPQEIYPVLGRNNFILRYASANAPRAVLSADWQGGDYPRKGKPVRNHIIGNLRLALWGKPEELHAYFQEAWQYEQEPVLDAAADKPLPTAIVRGLTCLAPLVTCLIRLSE